MSLSVRDVTLIVVAVLAFPLAVNITDLASSDGVPDRSTPLWHRGGSSEAPAAQP